MATANESEEKKRRGRPRKSPLPSMEVAIVGRELAESSSRSSEQLAIFCLAVPHRLLLQWRKEIKEYGDYIPLLNSAIVGEAVVIRSDCGDVGRRYAHAHNYL